MTGFGKGEIGEGGWRLTGEIKSVNHRYFSLNLHIPPEYGALEVLLQKIIKEKVPRGRIDVYVKVEGETEKTICPGVNRDLFFAYRQSLEELTGEKEPVSNEFILSLPGVLEGNGHPDAKDIEGLLIKVIKIALEDLLIMQNKEGEYLKKTLKTCLEEQDALKGKLEQMVSELENQYFSRLKEKLQRLLVDIQVDDDRLLQEAGILAEKSDITEELDRLDSHMCQFRDALDTEDVVGKKLDFIAQEMQRELNTMGAKTGDNKALTCIIEMKGWVERVREQVQNIL